MTSLLDAAKRYYDSGLNVLPAKRREKRPIGSWKQWTKERPAFDAVFPAGLVFDAICVVCGATSGGLEIIDFDQKAALYPAFCKELKKANVDINFVLESTQRGGKHLAFRSSQCGKNQKLANNAEGVVIETRGEGGICLIAPSEGYELESGDWTFVPEIDPGLRDLILDCARVLDADRRQAHSAKIEKPAPKQISQTYSEPYKGESASDYLRRELSPLRDSLRRAGWKYLFVDGDYEQWERPDQPVSGKPGGSINVKERYFYCFSSNAAPFEPNRCYSPLDAIALLDFKGDASAASKVYAKPAKTRRRNTVIDVWHADDGAEVIEIEPRARRKKLSDGFVQFPESLLNCGGMLQEIQSLMNELAIRPQPEGAFLGSLCSLSYLTGRSIALNYAGTLVTPNLYGLFLAPSGMGKEAIRRVSAEIAKAYAPGETVPESFSSVQALQNMVARIRKVIWLHDEFGRDLSVMGGEKTNGNITGIITEALKLYSNANNRSYLPKLVAQEAKDVKKPNPVDRPSLTIFATGNPREYFSAASDALLRNGYIARFTTVVGRTYSEKKKTTFEEASASTPFQLTDDFKSRIAGWAEFEQSAFAGPWIVPFTRKAFNKIQEYDESVEKQIRLESATEEGAAELKARFFEKVWKYALLFAASRYGTTTKITVDEECAEYAIDLLDYESRLFTANSERFSENPATRLALDVRAWAEAIGGCFTRSEFTRKFQRRGSRREREDVLQNLIDAEYLGVNENDKNTRYFLI